MRAPLRILIAAASCAVFAAGAMAGEAVKECRGSDMLAEMATKDAATHDKIVAEAAKLENASALLFKVEKSGVAPSYLFGTIHLSDTRVSTVPSKAAEAFNTATALVLEVADLSPNAMTAAMIGGGADTLVYSDGRSLSGELTPDEFAKVKDLMHASGMPGELAGVIRPWLVSTLLSVSDCERAQTAAGKPVLDMHLAQMAKARGIPVLGLETIQEQLAAMSGVPEDQQIQMLKVGLKYTDRTDDLMETMLQFYLKRQMGAAIPFQLALAEKAGVAAAAFEGFQKKLLVDRNVKMLAGAKPIFDKGGAFIAVGGLHLPGKTGLVALLREAGYTVTPAE